MTAFPIATLIPAVVLEPLGGLAFALERPEDAILADALIDRAFGPGRYAKTAERLREGNRARPDLSICAWDGERIAGVVRQWPVLAGERPAAFLGPFAVGPDWRKQGLGRALIARAVALGDAAGEGLTLLVGDQSYFGPLGFEPVPPGRIVLPGPVDPKRILWRAREASALDGAEGLLRIPPLR